MYETRFPGPATNLDSLKLQLLGLGVVIALVFKPKHSRVRILCDFEASLVYTVCSKVHNEILDKTKTKTELILKLLGKTDLPNGRVI